MRSLLLLGPALLVLTACGGGDVSSSGAGHTYETFEQQPHPALAEGEPTVEVDGRTFCACPPIAVGQATPLIEDACLTPGDVGVSRYDDYSMLEPSVDCANGKKATDAPRLGWGFVGKPLIAQDERSAPSPSSSRRAVLDCLRAAGLG